jgi:putative radical SAM enzyme (TIGR03279 family)
MADAGVPSMARPERTFPATVTDVVKKSAGWRCGIRPGDRLLTINDLPLRDTIDVRVYSAEPEIALHYDRDGKRRTCTVRRRYGEPLGLTFAADLFDGPPRVCRNHCAFCFVAQMAPGLRAPLYVKDDDYRLSFLHGNYITLTNLEPVDWQRIEDQVLSPLYISVHATEPDVRVGLMRNPRAGSILTDLQRLAEMGVEVHTQAVLVPGRNDGAHLDRTIGDLAARYPVVRDLSVVPVGLTRWHARELRPYRADEAADMLEILTRWQAKLIDDLGVRFVYPSDEWFLLSDTPVPELSEYDGLLPAMIENGVGMTRSFLEGQSRLSTALSGLGRAQTWVTGALFAPVLMGFARRFAEETAVEVEVVSVPNRFFGETVTVAGLLTVGDVLHALEGRDLGQVIVLPAEMFRGPEGRSLDGCAAQDIVRATNRPVTLVAHDGGLTHFTQSARCTIMGIAGREGRFE